MEINLCPSLCPSVLMREPAKTMGERRDKGSFRLKGEKQQQQQQTWQKWVTGEMKSFSVSKVGKMDVS